MEKSRFLPETLDGNEEVPEEVIVKQLKVYLVVITVEIPYPKSFEYRESASSIAPAVSRAIKKVRKELSRKHLKEMRIKAIQL